MGMGVGNGTGYMICCCGCGWCMEVGGSDRLEVSSFSEAGKERGVLTAAGMT